MDWSYLGSLVLASTDRLHRCGPYWRSAYGSRAKLFGHAIHPTLIVFPLGLFTAAVIFDLIRIFGGSGDWGVAAFYDIAVGVIGGLLAAVFGFVDWLSLPANTRAKSVGLWHGIGNFVIVVLFIISWLLRLPSPATPGAAPFILGLIGVLLALITGWLGGELVERLRVGVDEGAHLNAKSSLSGPAAESSRHVVT
jgi:uncharacterized membrane protein